MRSVGLATASVLALSVFSASTAMAGPGDLDRSLGGDGKIVRDLSERGKDDHASGVAMQGRRIVVAGRAKRAIGGNVEPRIALTRFQPNGKLDRDFSGDGIKYLRFSSPDMFTAAVEVDGRGRIVLAVNGGISDEFNDAFAWDGAIIRLKPDGEVDRGFGRRGKLRLDPEGPLVLEDLALGAGGKIVVAGTYYEPDDGSPLGYPSDFAVARALPSGKLDQSFSGDGWETTDLGTAFDDGEALALTDESVTVVGRSGGQIGLVRYTASGVPDPGFDDDGIQNTSVGVNSSANDVVVDGLGRATIAGYSDPAGAGRDFRDFLLARYQADGELDESFAETGVRTDDLGEFDYLSALALEPEGSLMAAGAAERRSRPDNDFALLRYSPSGQRKRTRLTDFGNHLSDEGAGIALDRRGRPVVAGVAATPKREDDFALARYEAG